MEREIRNLIRQALREDRSEHDVTSRLLFPSSKRVTAEIIVKHDGVVCGLKIAAEIFKKMDPGCLTHLHSEDGRRIVPGEKIMTVEGEAGRLLRAERTALNLLQHLSGVATLTRKFVDAIEGTRAKIYDTRKTIPGLRALQKYAVRCGGGTNHRMTLSEMAMVKDNHLKIDQWQSIPFLKKRMPRRMLLEIEAQSLEEAQLSVESKADIVMLDNMPVSEIKKSVRWIRSHAPNVLIEVSGGVSLKIVRKIARLGVDRISVGALTHSAPALDLSLEIMS